MIKVTLQKQNDREIEFIKEIELQVLPNKSDNITIDGKYYYIRSIEYIDSSIIMTVKDKEKSDQTFWPTSK